MIGYNEGTVCERSCPFQLQRRKNMTSKRKIVLLCTAVMIAVLLVAFLKEDIWDSNAVKLKDKLTEHKQIEETISLAAFTPFEWDVMHSFAPYTPTTDIYETVGYKWDRIRETVNEGMNQIVFMHGGEVVCHVFGYPSNNGYGILFKEESDQVLHAADDPQFQLRTEDGTVYLVAR